MKFFSKSDKTVLFVCVENAGRSQMAEGFFNKSSPKGYKAISAGTKPVSKINPLAVDALYEIGIDISHQQSKDITEDMIRNSDIKVNMGCMDKQSCQTLFVYNLLDWNIEDPKGKPIEKVREIRNEIQQRVKELVTSIESDQTINV
jgi:arsenate reductase